MTENQESKHIPNFTQIPNVFFDVYEHLLTPEEWKCLTYAARRIYGFHKERDSISLSQFANGTKNRDGEYLDHGTGLGIGTIKKCLDFLHSCKLLEKIADNNPKLNHGAIYTIQFDSSVVDIDMLIKRKQDKKEANIQKMIMTRSGINKDSDPYCDTEGGLCHSIPPYCDTAYPPTVTQQHKIKRNKDKIKFAPKTGATENSINKNGKDVSVPVFKERAGGKVTVPSIPKIRPPVLSLDDEWKELKWMRAEQRVLAEAFIEEAGEVYRPREKDAGKWRKEINQWIDCKAEPRHIKQVVQKLRRDRMTIKGVTSVLGTLRDIIGSRQIEDKTNPLMITSPEDAEKYYAFLKSRSTGE